MADIDLTDLPPVGSLAVLIGRIVRYEHDDEGRICGVVHDPIRPYREPGELEQFRAGVQALRAAVRHGSKVRIEDAVAALVALVEGGGR